MADNIVDSILGDYEKSVTQTATPKRYDYAPVAGPGTFDVDEILGRTRPKTEPFERDPLPAMPEATTEFRQGKPEETSWYGDVWKRLTHNDDETRARAANAMALSKDFKISPSEAYERHDELARETGLMGQPTNKEFIDKLMTGAVVGGLLTHPLATILGVSGFAALSEMESFAISKLQGKKYRFGEQKGLADIDPEVSRDTATFLEIVDFVGKGVVVGGGMKAGKYYGTKADALIKEKFLRDMVEEYRMPENIYMDAAKVREFFNKGKEDIAAGEGGLSAYEYDMLQSLGLDAAGYRDAVKYGIDIEIPAEKIIHITDKPWWANLKKLVRLNPYEETIVEGGGGPVGKRPVAGLLGEGEVVAEEMRPFSDMMKDINTAYGEAGAVAYNEGGLRGLTPEQMAARERLKRDFEVAKKKAAEAGQDIATFLKKMGIDEKIASYMVGEFGATQPEPEPVPVAASGGANQPPVVPSDPLFDIDRTIAEMSAAPYEMGKVPSYEDIRQKAAQIAYENYSKRVDLRKKREAALLTKQAELTVKEDPVYALMNDTVKAGGFNYDALLRDYSADTIKELMRKRPGLVSKKGKAYLDTAAQEYGFASGDALLNILMDAPSKAEAVAAQVRTFEETYGDELEADYSDLYVKMIDEEIKLMAQLTAGYKPRPTPGIKKVIRENTGQVTIGNIVKEQDALKAAMKKAEQASRVAWAQGKNEGAITEKLRQKEIAQKLRERTAARQESKKLKDGLIKLMKTPVGKDGLPPEYMDQVQELLAGYDLLPRGPKTERRLESLRELLQRHTDEGDAAGIPQSLIDRIDKKPWRELTLEELRDLHDAAEMIVHLGKLKNQLIASGKARDFNNSVNTIVSTIKKNYPIPNSKGTAELLIRENKSLTDKLSDHAKQYRSELIKPEYIIRRLDKWEDLGPVWQELFNPFNESEALEYKRGAEMTKKLLDAFKPFTTGFRAGAKWAHEKVKLPGVPEILTKEQMMMVALNTGNEGNLNALRYGNKFTDSQIDTILNALSKEEMALVNTIWDVIDSMKDDLSAVYRRLTGARMRTVDGRYFPLMFDRELSWRADAFQAEAEARDFFQTIYTKPAVEKGFTKTRTGGKMPVRLDFGVIFKHINDVNHYITHAEAVRDVQKLITNPAVRAIIVDRLGKDMYDQFMPWLQEIARPRLEPLSKTEKVLERIRANTTLVAMGFKFSTAAQQFLGYSQSIEELGFVDSMAGLSKFYANPARNIAFVNERSEMMANRIGHYDREIEALTRKLDPAHRSDMTKAAFLLIALNDLAFSYPTWTTAYAQGMERWGSEKKAIEFADMSVRKTQSTAAPKDLAAIQRGGSTKKLLTMFYTFFSAMQNQMMERGAQFRAGEKDFFDYIKAWWWIIIFPAVASELIRRRKIDPPHEYAKSVAAYRLGGLPLVRDVASGVLTDFDYQFSPVASGMIEVGRTGKELLRPLEGKSVRPGPLAKHGVQTFGYMTGVPTGQFLITAEGAIDLASGKTKDPTVLLMKESKVKK